MKKILFFLTLILTFTFSASFDCSKATTDVEKLICSNEELSKLDDELNKAYKEALNKTDNKEALIKEQRAWIKERNSCLKNCSIDCYPESCLQSKYLQILFYLQPDGFNIIYSEDNKTCEQFTKLLNDDLSKNGDINLSRHKEFNWIEWKKVQERNWEIITTKNGIVVDYFDINNDGNEEGVFISEYDHRNHDLLDIYYTTKNNGKVIEEYIPTKDKSKDAEIWSRRLGGKGNNEGYNVYYFTASAKYFLHNNNQINNIYGISGFSSPEPYPLKFDNNYFIAIFGTIEYFRPYTIRLYTMPNNGNIVALAKYNPDNTKNDVCILTRANPNTKKYLNYIKKGN